MELKKNEIRTIQGGLAIREAAEGSMGESRVLTGRAIVFNEESEILDDWGCRFREIIKPEAATQEFVDAQDIKLNLLHDRKATIGRKNENGEGNLKLEVREDGVWFEIDVPKCDLGDQALALVRSGVYTGCSFEFYPQDYDVEDTNGDVKIIHTRFAAITAVTIGMDPAYKQTSVNARELAHKEEEPQPVEEPTEEPKQEETSQREASAQDIAQRRIAAVRRDWETNY